jgi:hypothetical protein
VEGINGRSRPVAREAEGLVGEGKESSFREGDDCGEVGAKARRKGRLNRLDLGGGGENDAAMAPRRDLREAEEEVLDAANVKGGGYKRDVVAAYDVTAAAGGGTCVGGKDGGKGGGAKLRGESKVDFLSAPEGD